MNIEIPARYEAVLGRDSACEVSLPRRLSAIVFKRHNIQMPNVLGV
jgi:hypothetical protein